MKKKSTITLVLIIFCFGLHAQTNIPDKSQVSGVWTKANSPYIVNGLVTVPEGEELTIEPGVKIEFKVGSEFDIHSENFDVGMIKIAGKLTAIGDLNDSIYFDRQGNTGSWGVLEFNSTIDTSMLKYCVIKHSESVIYSTVLGSSDNGIGAITVRKNVNVYINSCKISNSNTGIFIKANNSIVENSAIANNKVGINSLAGSWYETNNPTVRNNHIFANEQEGIYLWSYSRAVVENNIIDYNNRGILAVAGSEVKIEANKILNNTNEGIQLNIDHVVADVFIIKNIIKQNGVNVSVSKLANYYFVNNLIAESVNEGIIIASKATVNFINQTIANNNKGIKIYNGSVANITSTILWENGEHEIEGKINLKNSIWDNSELEAFVQDNGENFFGVNPNFVNNVESDYSLQQNSPAINYGFIDTTNLYIPATDLIGEKRISNGRIDMGAFEFQQSQNFLNLVYPYQREYFISNYKDTIRWNSSIESGVDILLSTNNGESWNEIASGVEGNFYIWKAPELISDNCKLLIQNSENVSIADTTKYNFRISPNYIPANKMVYGIWKKEYSPYKVFGPITIPADSTLSIEPGVTVLFEQETVLVENLYIPKKGGSIICDGILNAVGTSLENILFSNLQEYSNWGNIEINNQSSSIQYCIIENGGRTRNGAIELNCNATFSHNLLRNNYQVGLYIRSLNDKISNNIFINNPIAIYNNKLDIGDCEISNCNFFRNDMAIKSSDETVIKNSIFYQNQKDYEGRSNNSLKIKYCVFDTDTIIPSSIYDVLQISETKFNTEPKFVDADQYDLHLRANSPCIDAGDPTNDFSNEPNPNGNRINTGAYGNTNEAMTSPLFTLNKYDISSLGKEELILHKENIGAQGNGRIQIGDNIVEILIWTNDSIVFVSPELNPGVFSILLIDSGGNEYLMNDFIDVHNPNSKTITSFWGLTSGGEEIIIQGRYFTENQQTLNVGNTQPDITFWSDTLIKCITKPYTIGKTDVEIEGEKNNYFIGYYEYFDSPITNLCNSDIDTLKAHKTYLISCELLIGSGKTLWIEEGVTLIFDKQNNTVNPKLIVNGSLIVNENRFDTVVFRSSSSQYGNWGGIEINGNMLMYNSVINGATVGVDIKSDNVSIYNSTVKNCSEWGILAQASASSRSSYNSGGTISGCEIIGNELGGIRCKASGSAPFSIGTYPVSLSSNVSTKIINNKISENSGIAIMISSNGDESDSNSGTFRRYATSNIVLTQNLIYNNKQGIELFQGNIYSLTSLDGTNNVLFNNSIALYNYKSSADLENSVIWGDNKQQVITNEGVSDIRNCVLDTNINGEGNINANPEFTSPDNFDFTLMPTSPCIDAGSNEFVDFEKDYEGKIRIWDGNDDKTATVDIGAFEFDAPCNITQLDTLICFGESFHNWSASGQYQLNLTNKNNCDSIIMVNLTVDEKVEMPTFTQNEGLLSTNATGNIQWYINGEPISGANNTDYTLDKSGEYQVEVTNENGCSAISAGLWCVKTGIDDLENSNFLVYPNPTSNKFNIRLKQNIINAELKIFTNTGQQVYNQSINGLKENQIEVSTNDWAKGVYHIQISTKKDVLKGKIVIN